MKLFFLFALLGAAAADPCDDSLGFEACSTCTGNTHAWVCEDTIATCMKCDNADAACTSQCEGHNFVSKDKTCISCGGITDCPNGMVTCKIKDGAVDPNSKKCKQCLLTHQKVEVTDKSDTCVDVSVDGCDVLTQQTCTKKDDNSGCKDKTKRCAKCKLTHHRVPAVTTAGSETDDVCVDVRVGGCDDKTQQSCSVAKGAIVCTAGTATCSKCERGYLPWAKDGADNKCVDCGPSLTGCASDGKVCELNTADGSIKSEKCTKVEKNYILSTATLPRPIAVTNPGGCESSTCTEADDKTSCKAGTITCTRCRSNGYFRVQHEKEVAKCVTAISGCKRGKTTCADTATGSTCPAGKKRCSECNEGYQLAAGLTNADDKCIEVFASAPSDYVRCNNKGATCTLKQDKSDCEAGSRRCKTCYEGYQLMTPTADKSDDKCVQVFDDNGVCDKASCTPNEAKNACAENSKRCSEASGGNYVKSVSGKDDEVVSCISATGACNDACVGTVTVPKGTGKECVSVSSLTGLLKAYCPTAKSATFPYLLSQGYCTSDSTPNCPPGTCFKNVFHKNPTEKDTCYRCAALNSNSKKEDTDYRTSPAKRFKMAVADLSSCEQCVNQKYEYTDSNGDKQKDALLVCQKGTCGGELNLVNGSCSNSTNSTGAMTTYSVLSVFVSILLLLS